MLVRIDRKGETTELRNRHFSFNAGHSNVSENINSNDPMVVAAIKRDSNKFRAITDLSARLAAM